MKKFLFYLAIIGLALASCSKDKDCNCDNNGNGNNGNGTATPTVKTNQIILGYAKDFKRFNIPEYIPENYPTWWNTECAIPNEETTLKESNKLLDSFFAKYEIVNPEGKEITHTETGYLIPKELKAKKFFQYPQRFEATCNLKEGENTPQNLNFGLMEKERIVVFYDSFSINFNFYPAYSFENEFRYKATCFYIFPTDDSYKEYVELLKSVYVDETEKFHFFDLHQKNFPLILYANHLDIGLVVSNEEKIDRFIPPFIPKNISGAKCPSLSDPDVPFSFYNSKDSKEVLNARYKNILFGKYRFENYYKEDAISRGIYYKEAISVVIDPGYPPLLGIRIGDSQPRGAIRLRSANIKLMPKNKAIAFYDCGSLQSFLVFSDIEPYNFYVSILKDVINNPEAQKAIFIED